MRVLAALSHRYLKVVYLYFKDASHGSWKGQEHRRIAKIFNIIFHWYIKIAVSEIESPCIQTDNVCMVNPRSFFERYFRNRKLFEISSI